ncbi:hypothetical protein D9M71_204800 [compost metagenome]
MTVIKAETASVDSATQSWADQAQAGVLAKQNEGVCSLHDCHPSAMRFRWQALWKNW